MTGMYEGGLVVMRWWFEYILINILSGHLQGEEGNKKVFNRHCTFLNAGEGRWILYFISFHFKVNILYRCEMFF